MKLKIIIGILLILGIISCNTASAVENLVTPYGAYKMTPDGSFMCIQNNPDAVDPTYDQLINFLHENKVDEHVYDYPSYTCGNYAIDLHDAAEAAGIKCGFVSIESETADIHHILNRFHVVNNTSDPGKNIDIDDTQSDSFARFGGGWYNTTNIDDPNDMQCKYVGFCNYEYNDV